MLSKLLDTVEVGAIDSHGIDTGSLRKQVINRDLSRWRSMGWFPHCVAVIDQGIAAPPGDEHKRDYYRGHTCYEV
jgi:hypothetical protein